MTSLPTDLAALAACPFCGGVATVYREHGRDCSFTWVGCSSCLMQTAKQAWMGNDSAHVERMTEAWNTRALASRDGVPAGWVCVPVEPTEDMVVYGFESEPDAFFSTPEEWDAYEALSGCQRAAHRARLCYAAMLKAAPLPGAVGGG